MKATITTSKIVGTLQDKAQPIVVSAGTEQSMIAAHLEEQTRVLVSQCGIRGATGAQGEQGVGIVWMGDYSPTTEYSLSNAVAWNNGSYIYIGTDPATGIAPSNDLYWDQLVEAGGSGGDYVRPTPMAITVGGATPGTTFDGTVNEALDTILYPYQAPAFSSFSLDGVGSLEVGDEIAAGNQTFSFNATNDSNVAADSIDIENVSDVISLSTGGANDNTELVSFPAPVIRTTAGTKQFRITGENSLAASFTRDLNISWYYRIYYGESANATLTEAQIEALRVSLLSGSANRTYAMNGGGYKYMVWATSLGTKSNFFDVDTGFAVAMQPVETLNITNSFGVSQDYYIYRTTNQLVGSINIQVS